MVIVLAIGMALVLATMFMWWRDIIREAEYQGHHTPIVQIGMRYGMMLFIASEVMFFVAFFWAFFDRALFPMEGVWPPEGIETFNPFDLPLINTLVLLVRLYRDLGAPCASARHRRFHDRPRHHGHSRSAVHRPPSSGIQPCALRLHRRHLSSVSTWRPASTASM